MMRIFKKSSVAFPYLIIVMLLMVILDRGLGTIIIAYSITGWTGMARLVRGQVVGLKGQEFLIAAQAMGAKPNRVIIRHSSQYSPVSLLSILRWISQVLFLPKHFYQCWDWASRRRNLLGALWPMKESNISNSIHLN